MNGPTDVRRVEVHFTTDDQALVVELHEDADGPDVDELIAALDAVDVDEAERVLRKTPTAARPIARLGSYRRW